MQTDRSLEIAVFLDQHGWGEAFVQPFDGDFSPRRYARLVQSGGATAILMDADTNQKTPRFVDIAHILHDRNIAAPEIYASDVGRGLVLMEDLGVRNIGSLLDAGEQPQSYFFRACEILAQLHRKFSRADAAGLDLPLFNTDLFIKEAELFLDAWFPFAKHREASEIDRQDFRAAWRAVLRPIEIIPKTLMLRDCMPDNLMDLPEGNLGVLDFQDAGIGPVAYDLASLCEEVRRDGGFKLLSDVIAHYRRHAQSPLSEIDMLRACTILSAQRHTRILGILAHQAIKTGCHEKLDYAPRIWRHLKNILDENYLLPVREWMQNFESNKQ